MRIFYEGAEGYEGIVDRVFLLKINDFHLIDFGDLVYNNYSDYMDLVL